MCAYKPQRISTQGISGMARVQINTKDPTKVRVSITRKTGDGEGEPEVYVLTKAQCPPYIKSGQWRVRLSSTGDKMFDAIPADEVLKCQFSGISHKENEQPAPKLVTGGKYEDYLQFIMNFVVVDGPYKDLHIPMFLRYHFGPTDDSGRQVVAYTHPKSKYTEMLDKVLTAIGIWTAPMVWQDNILPVIQKRAMKAVQEQNTIVTLVLTDGYVSNIKAAVVDDDDPWDGDDDEKTPEPVDTSKAPVSEPDPDDDDPVPAKTDDDGDISWDE